MLPFVDAALLYEVGAECAESPLWDAVEGALYWVDIPRGKLFRLDIRAMKHEEMHIGGVVGGLLCVEDERFLLLRDRSVVEWDGRRIVTIASLPEKTGAPFNDGCMDKKGRILAGTSLHGRIKGDFYRLEPGGAVEVLFSGLSCANGGVLSPGGETLFFADSNERAVYRMSYGMEGGAVGSAGVFFRTAYAKPDGMCVDEEGDLWCALWGGGMVVRYSCNGRPLSFIRVPEPLVTNVTVGMWEGTMRAFITTMKGRLYVADLPRRRI